MGAFLLGCLPVLWVVLTIIVAVVALSDFMGARKKLGRGSLIALVALVMCLAGNFYEFPSNQGRLSPTVIEVARNGDWRVCPWGTFESDGKQTFNVYEVFIAKRSVTPITDNPKARHISYTVPVEIENPGVFFLAKPERWDVRSADGVRQEVQRATEYWLYVFNDEHSKELATFYNPLDDEQVKNFRELLVPWLSEKLKSDGLKVKSDEVVFAVD